MTLLRAPTLRRRMIVSLGLMVLGTLAIAVGAILAVEGLHQDLGIATRGYRQLRQLVGVGFLASRAREAVSSSPPRPADAASALLAALAVLKQGNDDDSRDPTPATWIDESARADCIRLISTAIGARSPTALNVLFAKLSRVSDDVRKTIAEAQAAADRKRRITLQSIVALCIAVVCAAIVIGILLYRSVVGPVRGISRGVRSFAGGDFQRRISQGGDQEFADLASDFNRMADELSALYRDLEQKVRTKSEELMRAGQLASVGYLAAGVAHEINNPLGIIAGYGERAMRQLSTDANEQTLEQTKKAVAVICEEAFRCKQITDRLLSLARPGRSGRQVISIAVIAEQVVSNLAGLGSPGQRSLSVQTGSVAELSVVACEREMKQVILNLVINAIESVDPVEGRIVVRVDRRENRVELSVTDNGTGMTSDTVGRVFEPFFSLKRGERPGTGLGLSIVQAILTEHGGQIRADSGGPGQGSTFTISLPAAVTGAPVADP